MTLLPFSIRMQIFVESNFMHHMHRLWALFCKWVEMDLQNTLGMLWTNQYNSFISRFSFQFPNQLLSSHEIFCSFFHDPHLVDPLVEILQRHLDSLVMLCASCTAEEGQRERQGRNQNQVALTLLPRLNNFFITLTHQLVLDNISNLFPYKSSLNSRVSKNERTQKKN